MQECHVLFWSSLARNGEKHLFIMNTGKGWENSLSSKACAASRQEYRCILTYFYKMPKNRAIKVQNKFEDGLVWGHFVWTLTVSTVFRAVTKQLPWKQRIVRQASSSWCHCGADILAFYTRGSRNSLFSANFSGVAQRIRSRTVLRAGKTL